MIDLNKFSTAQTLEIWFKYQSTGLNFSLGACNLNKVSNTYMLSQGKLVTPVELAKPQEQDDLAFQLSRGCAYLCSIENTTPDAVQVRIIFFQGSLIYLDKVDIVHPESFKKNVNKFKHDLEIHAQDDTYLILLLDEQNPQQMTLVGNHYLLKMSLTNTKRHNDDMEWTLCKYESWSRNNLQAPESLHLCKGYLNFVDFNDADFSSEFAAKCLAKIVQEQGSYLAAWDKYCSAEGEILLKKARDAGAMRYVDYASVDNGKLFILEKEYLGSVEKGDTLVITQEIPDFLADENLTWEAYASMQDQQFRQNKQAEQDLKAAAVATGNTAVLHEIEEKSKSNRNANKFSTFGTVVSISGNKITLQMEGNRGVPFSGYLSLSVAGDLTQTQRRLNARSRIKNAKSANPMLGLIIEENGEIPQFKANSRNHIDPLTPEVKDKIFKSNPVTDSQLQAIDVALNTPDIALIQGPPGTGKTTVISAIVERLNQIIDPAKSRGSILVSAFQHDAVENLLGRLNVNSMPTIKFGSKQGLFTPQQHELAVEQWTADLINRLKEKHVSVNDSQAIHRLHQAFLSYSSIPNKEQEEVFLKAALDLPVQILSSDLRVTILDYLSKLRSTQSLNNTDYESLARVVYAIRDQEETYADDGFFNANLACFELEDYLDADDQELLSDFSEPKTAEYFAKIKELKKKLLHKILPDAEQSTLKSSQHIVDLMNKLKDRCEQYKLKDSEKVVADFIFELENNSESLKQALEEANTVFAATVQQSEGHDISKAKQRLIKGMEQTDTYYDTVIVDEAARASPLDLLIPMAKARNRIILVGDHKQLPHMINEEIVKSLERGEENQDVAHIYQQSMFEYLVNRLNQLKSKDGIERIALLDAQYRMHPLLGNFVSNAFYEGKVNSPLPAERFSHCLPDTDGKAAIWLDVPQSMGKEEQKDTSRYRDAEAVVICMTLKKWMKDPQCQNLSFGVISFYKQQVNVLNDMAIKYGILERSSQNKFQLATDYEGAVGQGRLRINTVDAFQGMEFDVVFLSMVRSNEPRPNARPAQVFGHLMSKNRLCVSLSRQKKVLVIVGDHAMLDLPLAQEGVPELKDFYKLCVEQGKVLHGEI